MREREEEEGEREGERGGGGGREGERERERFQPRIWMVVAGQGRRKIVITASFRRHRRH